LFAFWILDARYWILDESRFRVSVVSDQISEARIPTDLPSPFGLPRANGPTHRRAALAQGRRANGPTGQRANGPTGQRANGPTGQRANGPTDPTTGKQKKGDANASPFSRSIVFDG